MIGGSRSVHVPILDSSQVGEARRAAAQLSQRTQLDPNTAGKVAILVTELANNLHTHARDGMLLMRALNAIAPGVELLAVDRGPGMADVAKCFRDGYSTSGTPGNGLGAVSRLADRWDIHTILGVGTVLMAQVGAKARGPADSRLSIGALTLPMSGETQCGDNWAHCWSHSWERVMLADGLGHGLHAAEASEEAERIFHEKQAGALSDVMQAIHLALRKTRGAAVALAELDVERRLIRYVGVGNIAAVILDGATCRSLVSHNGTVGHMTRKIQEFQYPWPPGSTLVMNSDGLVSKWDLSRYPGLLSRHPTLIAGSIWRDYARNRDDVTVVAAREGIHP